MLIGRFNPRVFQPMWFAARGLLAEEDVDADSVLMTDGFSNFVTREFGLLCTRDRWQVMATRTTPTPDILLDLTTETFTLLAETPVSQIGINHQAHVPKSDQSWDTVVAQLGDPQRRLPFLGEQRLQTIEFRSERDDDYDGSRGLVLQPSVALDGGVWFQLNDHVSVNESPENVTGAEEAVKALRDVWDESRSAADAVLAMIAPEL